jgi:hypothetical protein
VIYNEAAINAWMVNQPVLQPVTPLERDHMMNSPLYITVRGKTGSTFSMKMTVVE